MNNEINTMIELQHYWDIVMQKESEIERYKKSIQLWEKQLIDLKNMLNKKDLSFKNLTLESRQSELKLEEIDAKIIKIEERKNIIKSERELEAQNNELKLLKDEKDSIESIVLDLMDKIEKLETEIKELRIDLETTILQTDSDINSLKLKIENCQNEVDKNKAKFNELLNDLSPSTKVRFSKLINSKDGIAIAKLNGEICSRCNFQIPSALAVSTLKRESLNTCTNCGRFIY
ncbi:MAG TPA: hypothetical protein PKZ64_02745 [Spirochaetota bacterium]|nr:hypothetical protein [Spirochaetota bacterium]